MGQPEERVQSWCIAVVVAVAVVGWELVVME